MTVLERDTLVPDHAETSPWELLASPAARPAAIGGLTDAALGEGGRWRRPRLLAFGGLAEVYEVEDAEGGPSRLLKTSRRDRADVAAEAIDHEARHLRAWPRPGAPRVLDRGRLADGRPWFVMNRAPGAAFSAWIARTGGVPVVDAVLALRSAARTVGLAHAQGYLHRDLKPGNLVWDLGGEVTVIDWGLVCRQVPDAAPPPRLAGTPGYMAPEMLDRRAGAAMPTADVFALGCTFFDLVWGEQARETRGFGAPKVELPAQDAHAHGLAGRMLRHILSRAVHPDPELRLQDGAALAAELDGWIAAFA